MKYIRIALSFVWRYFLLLVFIGTVIFFINWPGDYQHKVYERTFSTETLTAIASIDEQYRPWSNIFGKVLSADQERDTTINITCTRSNTIIQAQSRHRAGDIIQQTHECSPGNDVSFTHTYGYILFVQGGHADRWNPHYK